MLKSRTEIEASVDVLVQDIETALERGLASLSMPPASPERRTLHIEFHQNVESALKRFEARKED